MMVIATGSRSHEFHRNVEQLRLIKATGISGNIPSYRNLVCVADSKVERI